MARGGKNTAKKYGVEYMRMLARKGGKKSGKVRSGKLSTDRGLQNKASGVK